MTTSKNRSFRLSLGFCGVCLLILASACASGTPESNAAIEAPVPARTIQGNDGLEIQTLGFLDDYEQLAPGHKDQASLIFIDAATDFSTYSAIVVEPVVARALSKGDPTVATQELAKDLDAALRRELAHEFELVEQPRAGALRMRAALASKQDSRLVLEVELLDGATAARVVAAVDDRRLGGLHNMSEGSHNMAEGSHTVAEGSASQIDAWARRIRDRLVTFRHIDAAWRARQAGQAP